MTGSRRRSSNQTRWSWWLIAREITSTIELSVHTCAHYTHRVNLIIIDLRSTASTGNRGEKDGHGPNGSSRHYTEFRLYRICVRPSLLRRCIVITVVTIAVAAVFPTLRPCGVLRGFFFPHEHVLPLIGLVYTIMVYFIITFSPHIGVRARRDSSVEYAVRPQRHAPLFPVQIILPQQRSL